MTFIKLILTIVLLGVTVYAKNQAILKIDPKGHTGIINDIVIDSDGNIISASDDKTIRVWGSDGVEKRKILGQIGVGSEGKIFAIALSGDDKYLAVGGYLAGKSLKDKTAIRIYNYYTGKLIYTLKSHTNVVHDLSFSKDNHYLISGSADKTAKIWDVKNDFRLKDTIKFHTKQVYCVKIIKKANNYFAITASYDNQIALYDMQRKRIVNSHKLNYKLAYLATNDKHIAVCGDGREIKIYNHNLKLLKTIKSKTSPSGLNYSPNGKYLIAGTATSPRNVNIYTTKNYSLLTSFKKHKNLTMAVNFLDNKTAISGGGNNNEIYIWDIKTKKVKQKIVGVGSRIWSVGIAGDSVAWGNVDRNIHNKYSWNIKKSINLKTFKIDTKINQNRFHRVKTTNGAYSLTHTKGGDYGYSDGVLLIQKNKKTIAKIIKDSTNGYVHSCYGWYKDYIISGGGNGHLKIYNKKGKEVASLVGHTGEVWSIALDGDRLVSGSDDQSIKVWDLSRVGVSSSIYPMLSIFTTKDDEYIVYSKDGYFASSPKGASYIGYHINQGTNKEARFVGVDSYFETLYQPKLIQSIWQLGSQRSALAYVKKSKRVNSIDVTNSLPPVVTLMGKENIKTSKNSITIKYRVESDTPIKKVLITQNGKIISNRAIKRKQNKDTKSVTIELEDGKNYISIKAKNRFAFSDEVIVSITKTTDRKNLFKPTLYMLSIGVSKYKNSKYNLDVADKDAQAMTKLFKSQEGKIYKRVITKTLLNDNAISDNILDALDWIEREATSKDVVILFIAGHGVNDDKGNFYFLSHDANVDKLRRTAVKWSELEDTILSLPSKVVVLADSCHSGNIMGNRRDITGAIKSITGSGSGAIIITATTGSGYSYEEKSWGHGAFTKAFLDGLGKMKADLDGDGTISIKEIDWYITSRVKKLTKGKQKPTIIIPKSIPDFAIGVK